MVSILQALEAPQICTALLYLLAMHADEPMGTLFAKNMSGSWFTNACCAIFFTNRYGFGLYVFRFSF